MSQPPGQPHRYVAPPPPPMPPRPQQAPPVYPPQLYPQQAYGQQVYLIPAPQKPKDKARQRLLIINAVILCLVVGYFMTRPATAPESQSIAIDGRSNLSSNAATLEYPQNLAVSEWVDTEPGNETWTAYTRQDNPSSSIELWDRPDVKLADEPSVNAFIASKTIENSELAGRNVQPEVIKVDGKTAYLWEYRHNHGDPKESMTQLTLWVPRAERSIRLKCEMQTFEFERADAMCNRAVKTLRINQR